MGALVVDCPACGDRLTAPITITEQRVRPDVLKLIFSTDARVIDQHVLDRHGEDS